MLRQRLDGASRWMEYAATFPRQHIHLLSRDLSSFLSLVLHITCGRDLSKPFEVSGGTLLVPGVFFLTAHLNNT